MAYARSLASQPGWRSRLPNWLLAGTAALVGIAAVALPPLVIALGAIFAVGIAQPLVLLILTFILAPIKTLLETETGLSIDPGQIAFVCTLAVFTAQHIAARRGQRRVGARQPVRPGARVLPLDPIQVVLIVIILAASLSLFVAISPRDTVAELVKWVELLLMATLVAGMCERTGWPWIVAGLLGAASAQAVLGLYQFYGGSGAAHLWILNNTRFRAFGTFGQPNPFGAFLELVLPIAVGLWVGVAALLVRKFRGDTLTHGVGPNSTVKFIVLLALLTGVILLLGGGLVASWSRGAWLGFGAALLVMLLFAPRRRRVGIALVSVLIMLGAASAALGILPSSVVARLSDFSQDLAAIEDVRGQVIDDNSYAVLERLAHWQAAAGMINDHPLLGVGFGNYEEAYPQYELQNWVYALGHAHNYYLNMFAETGIVGFLAYVGGWIAIFFLTIRALRRLAGLDRALALGLLGSWTALSVHSVFDKIFVNNLFLHIGALLGLMITLRQSSDARGTHGTL